MKELIITMDQEIIRTVIRNLISNAIKFTPPGGMVTILVNKDTEYMELVVADSGVDIAEENLASYSGSMSIIQPKPQPMKRGRA